MGNIILIVLIIWFVISVNKKNQKNAKRGTNLNGKNVYTGTNYSSYNKSAQNTAPNQQRPVQNHMYNQQQNRNQQRPAQNYTYQKNGGQVNQQELKRRLQQKYENTAKRPVQGNTYQTSKQQANNILDRAKGNTREKAGNSQKQFQESGGGVYTAEGKLKNTSNKPAEYQGQTDFMSSYLEIAGTSQESLIMKQVNDLMVKGYSGDLSFDRDFIAEGVEMLNSYEL